MTVRARILLAAPAILPGLAVQGPAAAAANHLDLRRRGQADVRLQRPGHYEAGMVGDIRVGD